MADKYIDFDVLARISSLELLARTVVQGFMLGLHRSPYRGFSVEFAEYRQYSPGDDIRFIDWNVYGRTDRYYVKQFEEETNLACHLLLDASASMGFKGPEAKFSKLEYGCFLSACLAYFLMGQRDSVSLTVFDSRVRVRLPARSRHGHLQRMLAELEGVKAGNDTNISKPMHEMAEGLKRRGMCILISDLLDDPAAVLSALQHFRFAGHDVLVFHVLDNAEINFTYSTLTEFRDLENGEKLLVSPGATRRRYMEEFNRFQTAYEKGAANVKADYRLFNTRAPLELALSECLHKRSRLG